MNSFMNLKIFVKWKEFATMLAFIGFFSGMIFFYEFEDYCEMERIYHYVYIHMVSLHYFFHFFLDHY